MNTNFFPCNGRLWISGRVLGSRSRTLLHTPGITIDWRCQTSLMCTLARQQSRSSFTDVPEHANTWDAKQMFADFVL